jgi:hypothetical protein
MGEGLRQTGRRGGDSLREVLQRNGAPIRGVVGGMERFTAGRNKQKMLI